MQNKLKKIIFLAGDIIILYLSLYLTLWLRYLENPGLGAWQSHIGIFSIIFIGWIIIFYIADLYNLHLAADRGKLFKTAFRGISIAGLLSAVFFYLRPGTDITPKTNLLIFVFVFFFLFYMWRQSFNWFLKARLLKNNIAVIGLNEQVRELISELEQKPHLGYKISFVIDDKESGFDKIGSIPIINNINYLNKLIKEKKINSLILTRDPHQSPKLRASLFACLPLGINIINLANFYETITGKIPIEAINQMWFLENLNEGNKAWFDWIKRIYDIVFALLILLLTSLFWPVLGAIIKLQSSGPVFFRQIRAGKNNKPFTMIKFRTMTIRNNDQSPTKANDARVTKFGSFLRKARIDEIPQVLNVLLGDMSFIGPRPERPELIKKLDQNTPFYHERMLVKPGLTGWDQISGEYHSPTREDTLKKLQYDLFYIKNRSLYLDLSIALKTIATIMSRAGI